MLKLTNKRNSGEDVLLLLTLLRAPPPSGGGWGGGPLLQDYGSSSFGTTANVMNKNGSRWKKISYEYDLISGKVNMVMFQHGWRDGFFHRYSYDAKNRVTLAETSRDSLVWEKDARYDYYRHGPLARVTLGEQHSLSRLQSGCRGSIMLIHCKAG